MSASSRHAAGKAPGILPRRGSQLAAAARKQGRILPPRCSDSKSIIKHAWARVPQQWLANTSAPGVAEGDRRPLDLVVYGATRVGEGLCCGVTLVGRPQAWTTNDCGRHRTARYSDAASLPSAAGQVETRRVAL